jgi:hypothetical protein
VNRQDAKNAKNDKVYFPVSLGDLGVLAVFAFPLLP